MTQVAQLPKPSKDFKAFCDRLRCPLCEGQLDGNIHPELARLYCCNDNAEYRANYYPHSQVPFLELVVHRFAHHEYWIHITKVDYDLYDTEVERFDTEIQPIYKLSTRKLLFHYEGARLPFFSKRMDEPTLLKKLKTYLVFS